MNKAILFVLGVFFVSLSNAQISIDSSDIGNLGDRVYYGTDTLSGMSMSAASATAQTWNFSNLVQHELDSVVFLDPASTPNGSEFPTADFSIIRDGAFAYLTKTNNSLDLIGLEVDIQGLVVLPLMANPAQTIVNFPSTYGTNSSQTSIVDTTAEDTFFGLFDSIRLKRVIHNTIDVDAFGSLTTPNNTYSDVLRQYVVTENIDTVWTYNAVTTTWTVFLSLSETVHTYQFYAENQDLYVMEASVDGPAGSIESVDYQLGSKPLATASITPPTCMGDNDGFVDQDVVGGNPPYTFQWSNGGTSEDMGGLTGGTYTVTIYDQTDSTVYQYNLLDPTELVVTGVVQDETFGNDGVVDQTVTGGVPNYTFLWNTGSTTEDLTNASTGNYTVTITDDNGCTMVEGYTVGNNTSTSQLALDKTVYLFPNPVISELTISAPQESELKSVKVLSVLGVEVLSKSFSNSSFRTLELSQLPSGVYLLQLNFKEESIVKRILKQ